MQIKENKKLANHNIMFNEITYQKAKEMYSKHNFRSTSELINAALEFYLSYLEVSDSEIFLSEALTQVIRSTVQTSENRIARLLFKIAVADAEMKNILAAMARISPETAKRMRAHAVQEVKETNGILDLKDAATYQMSEDE